MNTFHAKVCGIPVPQGSSRAFVIGGRARITSANKNLKPWRQEMAAAFLETMEKYGHPSPLFTGPVSITAVFLMPRTKSLPKSKEKPHTVKPDLDKLIRSVADSLSNARVLADDSIITSLTLSKRYALANEVPGVEIVVRDCE